MNYDADQLDQSIIKEKIEERLNKALFSYHQLLIESLKADRAEIEKLNDLLRTVISLNHNAIKVSKQMAAHSLNKAIQRQLALDGDSEE